MSLLLSARNIVVALCLAVAFAPETKAAWPERPITLVHGFGAGGNADVVSRIVADRLATRLGQAVIVEAKPGAGGRIAAQYVARTAADGYTLIMLPGGHAVAAAMYEQLPYDTLNDFSFISLVSVFPFVLATYPDHPVKSIADLIAAAKTAPNPMLYGTSGVGTGQHMSGASFAAMAEINLQHVPSKGGMAAPTMLLGKHIDFVFETPTLILELVKSGQLRAIATTGKTRFFGLPDVPTISENISGYETTSWLGLAGPPKLPDAIVARLNAEIAAILKDAATADRLRELGGLPTASTPEGFKERVATDVAKFSKTVTDAGIKRLGASQ
jgi:tripartite-type tricarboxylate transporter receptor subunit TctC